MVQILNVVGVAAVLGADKKSILSVIGRPARPWLSTVARVLLAAVLFWAGWAKFTQPPALQKQAVEAYQLVPGGLSGVVGYGLPALELVLALILLAGFATRFGAILAGLLMVVFIGGIASAWARGLSIDCGCFGGGGGGAAGPGETEYPREILRDILFLGLAVWIAVYPRSRFAVDELLGL
jgi:uncharacterized membrane protein YphA (DoxX/SURF4 family)